MKLKLAIAGLSILLAGCYSAKEVDTAADQSKPAMTKEMKSDANVAPVAATNVVTETSQLTTTFYFQYDKSTIDETNKKLLQAVADYLVKNPEMKVNVIGHTDVRGTKEYNLALGQRRADAVAALLKEHGVHADQINVMSHGKENLLSTSENDQAQALNRRVEIVFVK
jgi:peptidoglycan-associated lipoprotein